MLSPKLPLAFLCALAPAAIAGAPPARDARGIEVVSRPAVPPPGFNATAKQEDPPKVVPPTPINPPGPEIPWPTTGPAWGLGRGYVVLPPCTRTVTDRCVQTYEFARPRPTFR